MSCLKRVKSRELRHGFVYIDCDCYHRNGLQHDCPRTNCEGSENCTIQPWPKCDLGAYFQQKWKNYYDYLDELPATSYCGPWKPGANRPTRETDATAKVSSSSKAKDCSKKTEQVPEQPKKDEARCVQHPPLPKLPKKLKAVCNDRKPEKKPVEKPVEKSTRDACCCGQILPK